MTDLGNLGGAGGNVAFDINDRGQIVGQSNLPGDTIHHAFLWQNGVIIDLGTLPGLPTSLANGINSQGQIVGFSQDANGDTLSSVAFLWQNGVLTDLNTLIPPNSPLFLLEALGISDRGQIAGYGLLSNGAVLGYLLTPCWEGDEGCGGGGSENAVLPTSPASRNLPRGTLPSSLLRQTSRYHFPGRAFGRNWRLSGNVSGNAPATNLIRP